MQLSELNAHRHTATTRFGEISYIEIGAGPVALFVHGIATNAYLWRHVMEALSQQTLSQQTLSQQTLSQQTLSGQRRCIAVDLPLHGQSPVTAKQDLSLSALAATLDDFCEVLGLTDIDLVANDTGGAIAQILAACRPQRLATLTLTNCDTVGNLPPEAFRPTVDLAAAGNLAPAAVAMFANPVAAAQVSFASAYEHLDRIDPEVIRSYLEPCLGTIERARQFERMLVALDVRDLEAVMPQLTELTVPTLVVWGTDDPNFDVSWAYWLRDTIPGTTQVITVDGARLFFPEERPMDLVPHLEQHWAAVAAGRS